MIETIITGDLGVNTYIYNFEANKALIIDPGSDSDKILEFVNEKQLDVVGIILTHGHFDHIGALTQIKNEIKAPIYIHSDDSTFLGKDSKQRHIEMFKPMGQQGLFYVDAYYTETPEADEIVTDGQLLDKFNLKVIHTPGHSPGSICLYSEVDNIIFTGDTLFKNGLGRTDFGGGNYSTLLNSLKKLLKLPGDTKVYPGHGPITSIKNESRVMP